MSLLTLSPPPYSTSLVKTIFSAHPSLLHFLSHEIKLTQCCGSGSGIRCLFDPWIRDPGWVKVRIRIRDEQLESYFRELRNHGLKYLNSLMRIRDPGLKKFRCGIRDGKKFRILDPGWEKFGSGIRDKHPGSASLL
jgi:hypothetical protein